MQRLRPALAVAFLLTLAASAGLPQTPSFQVIAKSELDLARPGQTIEVPLLALKGLGADDLAKVAVVDTSTGRELLAQAIDGDGDDDFDRLAFQADFAARETKSFALTLGRKRVPRADEFRVYGRFVRERFDDFAWENDRVAHRTYGQALETWRKEPLTSSAIDVWVKRTRHLVVNDWYMTDDYHVDHGEGADLYSAGPSRGCGGSGIWEGGALATSKNFRGSRVLTPGPLRLTFELTYAPWTAGPRTVAERKRVTLDAGTQLNRFESTYDAPGAGPLTWAAGIKKAAGAEVRIEKQEGWIRTWEPFKEAGAGHLGCGIVLDPAAVVDVLESGPNVLVLAHSPAGQPAVYLAGSAWDRAPDITSVGEWDRYLQDAARRLASPVKIEVHAR